METNRKTMFMMTITTGLVLTGLLFLNGCKKSEPASTNVNNPEMAMEGMANMPTEAVTAENGQSTCPVMESNPIDLDLFVEYQGKKVYFCCADCKSEFLKDPEKYIAKLPQFSEEAN